MKKKTGGIIFLFLGIVLHAQDPGDLYTDFSGDGYFIENWTDTSTLARQIAVKSDGNILVAGNLRTPDVKSFVMMMDQSGNTLSGNFSRGFERNFTGNPDEGAAAIYELPDHKILIAGYYMGISSYHPYVIRMNADGSLDASFGTDGVFDGHSINMDVLDMDVYHTGGGSYKIVICGTGSDYYPQLAMISDDGNIDTDFGLDGVDVLLTTHGSYKKLTVDSDNNAIYAIGIINDAVGTIIAKYNLPLGKLNSTFGSSGLLIYPETTFFGAPLAEVLDKSDNTLTVFGGYRHADGDHDIFAYQMNATTGNPNTGFGLSGWAFLRNPSTNEEITSAVLQSDGKYCFAGHYSTEVDANAFVGRINHNGTPDAGFGTNGLIIFPSPNDQYVYDIALSPCENILYITGHQTVSPAFSSFIIAVHTGYVTEPHLWPYVPITVTNTYNEGRGSLNDAIMIANEHPGADTIVFNIDPSDPGYNGITGVWTIEPSATFHVETDSTVIDGTTQEANQGNTNPTGPEIEITGNEVINYGIRLDGGYSTVKGLNINQFTLSGIRVAGNHTLISGNYIGTDASGTLSKPNETGILVGFGANECLIGGTSPEDRNIISGNSSNGILIEGTATDSNMVQGNYIGTDYTGESALGNFEAGIRFLNGPTENVVRGNLISGNSGTGAVWYGNGILVDAADKNLIIDNLIGTDKNGTLALPNMGYGIFIHNADRNFIGIEEPVHRNVISGNALGGVYLFEGSDSNIITNNVIGTDLTGSQSIPNGDGVYLYYNVQHNFIGPGNSIVSNSMNGIYCRGETTIWNTFTQNFINSNSESQIKLVDGGNIMLASPEISNVSEEAVSGITCSDCIVEFFSCESGEGGQFEGSITADGSGHFIWYGSATGPNFTATATDPDGNTSEYCHPFSNTTKSFVVVNTNDSGEGSLRQAILNSVSTTGTDSITFNIPSSDPGYDAETGVWTISPEYELPELSENGITLDASTQTLNQGNTNDFGPEIELNGLENISVGFMLSGNNIVIKGFSVVGFNNHGILINGDRSVISDNYIGCSALGTLTKRNGNGIYVCDGAKNTLIGSIEGRNVISGNRYFGIVVFDEGTDSTVIQGNYIGTDYLGDDTISNCYGGIELLNGSQYTLVGGSNEELRNYICGSNYWSNLYTGNGINIEKSDNNTIQGNYIGVGHSSVLRNLNAGILIAESSYNQIGGIENGEGNLISGNSIGIHIRFPQSSANIIEGNLIGTDPSGEDSIGNTEFGILLDYGPHDNVIGPFNIIMYNTLSGIYSNHDSTVRNFITGNSIGHHQEYGILNEEGANMALDVPVISAVTLSGVTGTTCPDCAVEIFSDESDEGTIFEGSVYADHTGNFVWEGIVTGPFVTATAIDPDGNTSMFSEPFEVSTSVAVTQNLTSGGFVLYGNFPNPFVDRTLIRYALKSDKHITISVLDLSGREIIRLLDSQKPAGEHMVSWNGCDAKGTPVNAGIYICSMTDGTHRIITKMILLNQ